MVYYKKKGFILLAIVGYFVLWFLPRSSAVLANTLHSDDFWAGVQSWGGSISPPDFCQVPPKDFRWISAFLQCAQNELSPDWLLTAWPNIWAGIFIAIFSFLFFTLLVRWKVPTLLALVTPLIVIFHPIVNEITLWNSTASFSLWLSLALASYLLIDESGHVHRTWLAVGLLLIVVFAYEMYLMSFVVLMLSELTFSRLAEKEMNTKLLVKKIVILCGVSFVSLINMLLVKPFYDAPAGRELVLNVFNGAFIEEKIHGVFNLIVNVYLPIAGYYLGIERAWGAWKWIPVTIAVCTFLVAKYRKRTVSDALLFSAITILLLIVPTLPIFVIGKSPESWRVSIPVLISACIALVPLLVLLWGEKQVLVNKFAIVTAGQISAVIVLLLVFAFEIPVTRAEAKLRVRENAIDQEIVGQLREFWLDSDGGLDFRVGVFLNQGIKNDKYSGVAKSITEAYHPRGLISAFQFEQSWRGFLSTNGLMAVEVDSDGGLIFQRKILEGCRERPEECRLDLGPYFLEKCESAPDYIQKDTGIRLVHSLDAKISVVCL